MDCVQAARVPLPLPQGASPGCHFTPCRLPACCLLACGSKAPGAHAPLPGDACTQGRLPASPHLGRLPTARPRPAAFSLPACLPTCPWLPQDIVSELPERFFVGEIIRKHVFLQYRQEVPYGVTGGLRHCPLLGVHSRAAVCLLLRCGRLPPLAAGGGWSRAAVQHLPRSLHLLGRPPARPSPRASPSLAWLWCAPGPPQWMCPPTRSGVAARTTSKRRWL